MESVTSGQLGVWSGKVKWIRQEGKKPGIKDFAPGHGSCSLTDF